MGEKIALGYHTCVDYELIWDTKVIEEQIVAFDIHADELKISPEADSERAIWVSALAHLKAGIGGEIIPDEAPLCEDFANHFDYKITMGGTATRAAIVLDKLGVDCVLQTSCYNKHVERLIPSHVHVLPGVPADHNDIYPHVILQCAGGIRIQANDIDFVTPRENRIMISRDLDSLNTPVLVKEFGELISDAEVFLLGCFSQVIDKDVLVETIEKTKALLQYLPEDAFFVMEDGCYVKKDFRYYVHEHLGPYTKVLSMNEDEMQEYIGRRIDILNVDAVIEALEEVYAGIRIPILVVHSASWALAYGENADMMLQSLIGGVTMSATRFRIGDDVTKELYEETKTMAPKAESIAFCEEIENRLGEKICIVPCKDLSHVENPTVVGLGDSFAGGLLPGLLKENRG
ncbi:MAG: hypothetical protein IKJ99_02350 [Oscillospiraceae bacterium]|nr:hypothetical protein [Oscillospiraceae bacterium]